MIAFVAMVPGAPLMPPPILRSMIRTGKPLHRRARSRPQRMRVPIDAELRGMYLLPSLPRPAPHVHVQPFDIERGNMKARDVVVIRWSNIRATHSRLAWRVGRPCSDPVLRALLRS